MGGFRRRGRMAQILRGDIFWADLAPTKGNEQAGRRPVLILSHETFNEKSGTVIALAITSQSQRAGFPLTYELESLLQRQKAWVKISQIRTLSTLRLDKKMGHISSVEMEKILEGLNEIIS